MQAIKYVIVKKVQEDFYYFFQEEEIFTLTVPTLYSSIAECQKAVDFYLLKNTFFSLVEIWN